MVSMPNDFFGEAIIYYQFLVLRPDVQMCVLGLLPLILMMM